MKSKESRKVRYAYGVATALLLGGTAFSLATGPVGAQTAPGTAIAPVPGAPGSFADLAARVMPAVVNISTKQKVTVKQQQVELPDPRSVLRMFSTSILRTFSMGDGRVSPTPGERVRL